MRALCIPIFILVIVITAYSQGDEIVINNASFEDIPHKGGARPDQGIRGWYDCGEIQFPRETSPDIHPINAWEVNTPPSEGRTYLGMVIRDNDSWESLSQRLKQPLEDGKCYKFSIDLSRSAYYVSASRVTQNIENYTEPAVLRIWGGTGVCGRHELLAESSTVSNNEWQTYTFEFEPGRDVNYFTIEAFYEVPVLVPYNGHILVDNASVIQQIPCDGDNIFAVEEVRKADTKKSSDKSEVKKSTNTSVTKEVDEVAKDPMVAESKKPKLLQELDGAKVKKGQTIRIENLYFEANESSITENSHEVLDEVFDFLQSNRNIVVEIGGHTNTIPLPEDCDILSSNRAKEVATYLVRKGISPKRIQYKGYGKRQPIIKNDRYDLSARQKNQRVEIKILSLTYSESTG
jgi:outer membrane protein OmpA-like peptidoglycan-associated protein